MRANTILQFPSSLSLAVHQFIGSLLPRKKTRPISSFYLLLTPSTEYIWQKSTDTMPIKLFMILLRHFPKTVTEKSPGKYDYFIRGTWHTCSESMNEYLGGSTPLYGTLVRLLQACHKVEQSSLSRPIRPHLVFHGERERVWSVRIGNEKNGCTPGTLTWETNITVSLSSAL